MPEETGLRQIDITADLPLESARDAHATLCAEVASWQAGVPVRLEIAAGRATVPALQLLCATRKALEARGAHVTLGPVAAVVLPPGA